MYPLRKYPLKLKASPKTYYCLYLVTSPADLIAWTPGLIGDICITLDQQIFAAVQGSWNEWGVTKPARLEHFPHPLDANFRLRCTRRHLIMWTQSPETRWGDIRKWGLCPATTAALVARVIEWVREEYIEAPLQLISLRYVPSHATSIYNADRIEGLRTTLW